MRRRAFLFAALLVPAACAPSKLPRGALLEQARAAGQAMAADHAIGWAVVAAKAVSGRSHDATVEVMRAQGTTLRGRVVLRITARGPDGSMDPGDAACFEYRFVDTRVVGDPRREQCPAGPLAMARVPDYAGVSPAARDRVATLLRRLPASERVNATRVDAYLAGQLGLAYLVRTRSTTGGVSVRVDSGTQCLSAGTTRTTVTVGPAAHGTDCLGG